MFLGTEGYRSGYTRSGEQFARGRFLILMDCECTECSARPLKERVRGIVRFAALRQVGHWMMGSARIGGERVTLSGTYGGDGLTRTVSHSAWSKGVPVPGELYEAWNNGGGWNSAGSEAAAMQAWGRTIDGKPGYGARGEEICSVGDCHKLAVDGDSYCEAHRFAGTTGRTYR